MKILVDEMPITEDDCFFADTCWENNRWKYYCQLGKDGVSDCDLKNKECSFLKVLENRWLYMNNISRLDKVKNVIKDRYADATCGLFFTKNLVGDPTCTIWEEDGVTIDICYEYEYFEVFGLTKEEENELLEFYNSPNEKMEYPQVESITLTLIKNGHLVAKNCHLCGGEFFIGMYSIDTICPKCKELWKKIIENRESED